MYPRKHNLEIEHADGRVEKIRVSHPIALMIVDRLLERGWPYCSVKVDGQEIESKPEPQCTNVYQTRDGQRLVL